MPPTDSRKRTPRGPRLDAPEALEGRQLLAYSPLGYSLPNLNIRAIAGPVVAWGGTLAVTADVFNTGAVTIPEPFLPTSSGLVSAQAQGAATTADAPATVLDVYASTRPDGGGRSVLLGGIAVPAITENNYVAATGTLAVPARPAGFPVQGSLYLTYKITTVASYSSPQAVHLEAQLLPDLLVTDFAVPAPLVPGDVLIPAIQIANLGTAATDAQGPVTVEVVASQDTRFGPGDQVLATYNVLNIPPLSDVPTTLVEANQALTPGVNVITLSDMAITLPSSPKAYYLGVKVNPLGNIAEAGRHGSSNFDAYVKVGPSTTGLPPSTLVNTGAGFGTTNVFPFPITGAAGVGIAYTAPTGGPTTTVSTPVTIISFGSAIAPAATTGTATPARSIARPARPGASFLAATRTGLPAARIQLGSEPGAAAKAQATIGANAPSITLSSAAGSAGQAQATIGTTALPKSSRG